MQINRREFLTFSAAVIASGCGTSIQQSPAAPTTTAVTPPATPKVQVVPATGKYAIEVIANENIGNVVLALELAGLTLVVKDQNNWINAVGSGTFSGGLILKISNLAGNWRIDIDKKPFCNDVRNQPVRAGSRISCFVDDGTRTNGACFG